MKKVLYTLLFLCLFILPASAGYSVDSIAVSAEVSKTGKSDVTSTITLTFDSLTDSVTIPLPDGDISQVTAGDFHYKVKKTDEGTNVVISSSGSFQGTQSFLVSYSLPAPADNDSEADLYSLNLLSTRWEKNIGSVSYQISLPPSNVVLPEDFQLEPLVASGYYGELGSSDSTWDVTGTIVAGSVTARMAYDSLTVNLPLPEGYFYVRSAAIPVISITWLSLCMMGVTLLCMLYWRLKLRTPPQHVSPRLLSPDGVMPCQLSQVLDGATCDVALQILEWANLGYLGFRVGTKGQVMMIRRIPMGSERSAAEQRLFRQIFSSGDRVLATPGRFTGAAERFSAASRKSLSRVSFDRSGGNVVFVQIPCRLLAAISIGYAAWCMMPDAAGFAVLAVLLGFVGFIYSIYLHSALAKLAARREFSLSSFLLMALMILLLVLGLLSGALIEMLIGLFACVFSAVATSRGPRRSKRGQDLLAQTLGCRQFYRQVKWQKLQLLQGRNSSFFQRQLPKAIALHADKAFAKSFERLPIPRPEWLPGKRSTLSAGALRKQVLPIVQALRETFR